MCALPGLSRGLRRRHPRLQHWVAQPQHHHAHLARRPPPVAIPSFRWRSLSITADTPPCRWRGVQQTENLVNGAGDFDYNQLRQVSPWPTAAITMGNPYCSCKLTSVVDTGHPGRVGHPLLVGRAAAELCAGALKCTALEPGGVAAFNGIALIHPARTGQHLRRHHPELLREDPSNQPDRCRGAPQHGLHSNAMALVASDCDAIRSVWESNGPIHLGLRALQRTTRPSSCRWSP